MKKLLLPLLTVFGTYHTLHGQDFYDRSTVQSIGSTGFGEIIPGAKPRRCERVIHGKRASHCSSNGYVRSRTLDCSGVGKCGYPCCYVEFRCLFGNRAGSRGQNHNIASDQRIKIIFSYDRRRLGIWLEPFL